MNRLLRDVRRAAERHKIFTSAPVDHERLGAMNNKEIIDAARLEAARDVCPYCGGRAMGYEPVAAGPNEAGNWYHPDESDPTRSVLCLATAIYARRRFEAPPEPPK